MLVTRVLTIGQITFILRVVIQILSYGGLFLISILVFANTPSVTSVSTHDILNRAVGRSSFTTTSLKWTWSWLRGKINRPFQSTRLFIALVLLTLYGPLTSLSDIGFLGFYTCSVSGPSVHEYPASINTYDLAHSAIQANMVDGTDPMTLKAYRCDSAEAIFMWNETLQNCTAWHNSTWGDSALFTGLNMTDSDALMPRQLRKGDVAPNDYFLGAGSGRVENLTVNGGVVVNPHDTGFQAVFGVPQLGPQQKVTLEKALALEVEMGCMKLGVTSIRSMGGMDFGIDVFHTNGSWREYAGPEYLQDVLFNTTNVIRQYYTQFFNTSSLDSNGSMIAINMSMAQFSSRANIHHIWLPNVGNIPSPDPTTAILTNCTDALRRQLNLTVLDSNDAALTCSVFGLGGTFVADGQVFEAVSQMVCGTASQISMVSATIQTDVHGSVSSLGLTKLPSNLNYVRASYWEILPDTRGDYGIWIFSPIERYTLNDNPNGPSSHFVVQYSDGSDLDPRVSGPGSGGVPLSRAGSMMLNTRWGGGGDYTALAFLNGGTTPITPDPHIVTRWAGQVAASYILASITYNGWAARLGDSGPLVVSSTGGSIAICYHPLYALGFLPLFIAAFIVIVWCAIMIMLPTSRYTDSKNVKAFYGGIVPYARVVYAHLASQNTLLIRKDDPQPHLDVFSQLVDDGSSSESSQSH
jgi:hypothetical protein